MHIIISGSRDGVSKVRVWKVLGGLHAGFGITHIHHGGARGVDTYAAEWAETRSQSQDQPILVHTYEADWDTHGKPAGFIRNKEMIHTASSAGARLLVAFQANNSRGTAHAITVAEEQGMSTLIIRVN